MCICVSVYVCIYVDAFHSEHHAKPILSDHHAQTSHVL